MKGEKKFMVKSLASQSTKDPRREGGNTHPHICIFYFLRMYFRIASNAIDRVDRVKTLFRCISKRAAFPAKKESGRIHPQSIVWGTDELVCYSLFLS